MAIGTIDNHRDTDALRAIAVLSVILFHCHIAGFPGGYVGVDIFFVISGFLITHIIVGKAYAGKFSLLQFFERRIRRLIPSLYVVLGLSCTAAALMFSPADLLKFADSMMAALLMAANIFFFYTNGYFNSDAETKPLLHLWTLGIEAQFYLLWPIILMFALRFFPKRAYMAAIIVGLISIAIAVALVNINADAAFYLVPSRLFEFLIGAGLVWLPAVTDSSPQKQMSDVFLLAGLTMLGLGIGFYTGATPFPSFYALLPCIGAALVIYSAPHAKLRPLFSNPLMAYVGRISYELYLFHWVVIVFYKYISFDISMVDNAIMIGIALVLAMITYHVVGYPLRYCLTKSRLQRTVFLLGCLTVFAALMATAFSIKTSGGWPWRLPPEAQLFIEDPEAFHDNQFGGGQWTHSENILITLGDTTQPPQFLLIGDSFASQYAVALSEFLSQHHESAYLFFVDACLFMPNASAHIGAQIPECSGAYERMLPVLANNHLPIIQSQSWNSYKEAITNPDGSKRVFPTDNNNDYYAYIFSMIDQMRATLGERRYVFIGISPGLGERKTLAKCFAIPDYLPTQCAATVATPEETSLNGQDFDLLATTYAAAHPEIAFINPRTALCHDKLCYAVSAKQIFYSDEAHFSKAGARQVIDKYQDLFLSLHP